MPISQTKNSGREATRQFLKAIGYQAFESFYAARQYSLKAGKDVREIFICHLDADLDFRLEKTKKTDSNDWVGTGKFYADGWQTLENFALSGSDINIYAQKTESGIDKAHTKAVRFLLIESDTLSLEDQLVSVNDLLDKGLTPKVVSFSGSKSIHFWIEIEDSDPNSDEREKFYNLSHLIYGADNSLKQASKPYRFPGFSRVKNGETKTCDVLYLNPEASTTVKRATEILESQWQFSQTYTKERFNLYRKIVNNNAARETERFNSSLLESEFDAFEVSDDEVSNFLNPVSVYGSYSHFSGGKDSRYQIPRTAAGNLILKFLIPKYKELRLDSQYSFFNHKFKNFSGEVALKGCSPFSATNSSGSAFTVFNSGGWYCHASNQSGNVLSYILLMEMGTTSLSEEQTDTLAKKLCGILGFSFEKEVERFNSLSYQFFSTSEYDLEESDNDRKKFLALEESDFNNSSSEKKESPEQGYIEFHSQEYLLNGTLSSDRTFVLYNNPELSSNIATQKGLRVLSVSKIDNSLIRDYKKVTVIVEPGQLLKTSWRVFAARIAAAIPSVKFVWYGQIQPDAKNFLEFSGDMQYIKFEQVENLFIKYVAKQRNLVTYSNLTRGIDNPDLTLSQPYVSDLAHPEAGKVTIIDSGMGTGKTEYLSRVCQSDNFRKIISLGYRNGLLENSAERTGLTLLSYLEKSQSIRSVKGVSLCVDSFLKLSREDFYGALVVFDEIEAVVKHLVTASTEVSKNRGTIMAKLQEYVKYALATGGAVLGMEANITNETFEKFIKNILGVSREDIFVVKNTFLKSHWDVKVYTDSDQETIARLAEDIANDKPCLVASDSLERIAAISNTIEMMIGDYKHLVISSETVDQEDVRDFLKNPQTATENNKYTAVFYSPTLESGGDITTEHYQKMYGFFNNGDTRGILQQLGRLRTNVDREIYIASSFNLNEGGCDVETLYRQSFETGLKDNKNLLAEIIKLATNSNENVNLLDFSKLVCDENSVISQFMRLRATYIVRDNISRRYMAEFLIQALRDRGHNVSVNVAGKNEIVDAFLEESKFFITSGKVNELWDADISDMTAEMANKILSNFNSKKSDRVKAKKFKILESYPGMAWSKDKVRNLFFEGRGETIRICRERFYLENPDVARGIEAKDWERQLTQLEAWIPDIKFLYQRGEFYRKHKIIETIKDLSERDQLHSESAEFRGLMFAVLKDGEEAKRLFKFGLTTDPIKLFNKFLKRIGLKLEFKTQAVESGKRVRVYNLVEDGSFELRQEILNAMSLYYSNSTHKGETLTQLTFEGCEDLHTKTTIYNSDNMCEPKDELENQQSGGDKVEFKDDVKLEDVPMLLEICRLVNLRLAEGIKLDDFKSQLASYPRNIRDIFVDNARYELTNNALLAIFESIA